MAFNESKMVIDATAVAVATTLLRIKHSMMAGHCNVVVDIVVDT